MLGAWNKPTLQGIANTIIVLQAGELASLAPKRFAVPLVILSLLG